MANPKQPGEMLHFDLRPCLRRLSNEEKGILFESILDYAQHGVVPELEGIPGVAWDFIRPRLDRDAQRYEAISLQRSAAAQKRWRKEE